MRLAVVGLVVLAALAIGLGLWVTGGAEQARRDTRDAQRMADLRALATHMRCLDKHGLAIPSQSPLCPEDPTREDPLTGAPYEITQPSAWTLRLCASFENDPPRHHAAVGFDPETGCLTISLANEV